MLELLVHAVVFRATTDDRECDHIELSPNLLVTWHTELNVVRNLKGDQLCAYGAFERRNLFSPCCRWEKRHILGGGEHQVRLIVR